MVKVFVAIDGSEGSKRALKFAIESYHNKNDTIVLVSAAEKEQPTLFDTNDEEALAEEMAIANGHTEEKALEILTKAKKEALEGLALEEDPEIDTMFVMGDDVRTVLVDLVAEHSPDILVVGSRGLGTISRLVLGSVSSYLAQHAACNVLIIR